ncbi:hypothetical protein BGZ76_003472 [Entomortierella beljakovae]|nr:hypothetical protein BGZ76_003472 [Entomortierella beljakovae]
MITSLFNTYKKVPACVSIALIVTILASATYFILPTVVYGNDSITYVNTTYKCGDSGPCQGWWTQSYYEDNVTEAMMNVINNTRNIPNSVDRRIYIPKVDQYKPMCNDFGLDLLSTEEEESPVINLSNGTCGQISIDLSSFYELYETPDKWLALLIKGSDSKDDLFQNMIKTYHQLTSNGTLKQEYSRMAFMEIQQIGASVEVLLCWVAGGIGKYACMINHFDVVRQGQPEYTSRDFRYMEDMKELYSDGEHGIYRYENHRNWADMVLEYISSNSSDNTISVSTMKNKTYEVTNYMAKLRHNVMFLSERVSMSNTDTLDRALLTFETADPYKGYEVPNWLLIVISILMVSSACIWALTTILLNERYTSSLYKLITMEMGQRVSSSFPVLMRSQVEPFEVEGVAVLAEIDSYEMHNNSSSTALMSDL